MPVKKFFLIKVNSLKKISLINVLVFFIPFELLIAYTSSGLIRPIIGEGYKFFLFGNIISFYLLLFGRLREKTFNRNLVGLLLFFNILGFLEVIVTIFNNSFIIESITQYTLGFLSPSLLTLYISAKSNSEKKSIFYSFYLGTIVILLITFGLIFFYYETYPNWFKESQLSVKLFMFRYLIDGTDDIINPAMILLGNFNKASNYLLYLNLFSLTLLGRKVSFYYLSLFWIISTSALIILFSRLALLFLPLVYYFSGFHHYFINKLKIGVLFKFFMLFFFLVLFVFNSASLMPALEYLFFSKITDDSDSDVLGSGTSRFIQWSQIYDKYFNSEGIIGLGHGEYSFREYGYLHGGSHNLFIDHFLASGILFPILLFIMLILLLLLSFLNGSKLVTLSFLLFFMLAFREYSFSYLNATMQGGFYFCLILYLYSIKSKSTLSK